MITANRDTSRVDLRVTRIGEKRPLLVRTPGCGDVAALGVGRKVEDVAVAPCRQHDRSSGVGLDLAGYQVPRDDPLGMAVDQHDVEHLCPRVHLDIARGNLPLQCLVGTNQQLLPRLSPRIKCSRDLGTAEAAVVEQPAVVARERNSLCDALVDDADTYFSQTVNVCLAGTEIATLDRVVKEAVDAVPIITVILGRIDSTLCGNRVRAPRTILEAEGFDVIAQLTKRRRRRGSRQSGSNHDHRIFSLVRRIDQLHILPVTTPLCSDRTRWDL